MAQSRTSSAAKRPPSTVIAADMHRTPEISPNEIQIGELIGEGSFGKVYKGKCRGKDVAIKRLHKPIVDEKILNDFKKEVHTMSSFQHPNICLFMGACTQPGSFFIVSEYLVGGDVESLLQKEEKKISLFRRLLMAKDAAMGMNWLHLSNPAFIHRDLKTSNLLIDENGKVKVCDFGLSEAKEHGAMLRDHERAMGTPLWMAPEVMLFKPFNEKVDVYSFGIVLWEIVTRKAPFAHHTDYAQFRDAVCNKHERPPIPAGIEPTLADLIQRCWHADPQQRPSFDRILLELDHILVHVAISDNLGRAFWKHHYLGLPEVPWTKFVESFCEALGHPLSGDDLVNPTEALVQQVNCNIACLKALLAVENTHNVDRTFMVDCERFGELLDWFGPIGHPDSTKLGNTILDHIRDVCRQPWFHGDITDKTAAERLAGKAAGTYLVRFSSQRGCFTISQIVSGRTVKHFRIEHHINGPFCIDNQEFPSLFHLMRAKVEEKRKLGVRMVPCEGSRFEAIFKQINDDGGYVEDNGYAHDVDDEDEMITS